MKTLKTIQKVESVKSLIDGRKEYQHYRNNLNVSITVEKNCNYYSVYIEQQRVRSELTKLEAHELLTLLGAEKRINTI